MGVRVQRQVENSWQVLKIKYRLYSEAKNLKRMICGGGDSK